MLLDQDLGEHPSVLVNGGATTPIGAAGAGQVAFTISGLEADDSGTLTFSDQAGHAVVVAIANGQAVDSQGHPLSTVNLSSLSDGTITSSLAISDPAGNQFSASGNTVPLDQDLGEHPSVLVNGGSPTPIGAARAGQVAFTISGLASDDSGTLTFSDQAGHAVVVAIANGQAVDSQGHPLSTVNLSSLSDGTITSSLAISDPAGNQFSASGNAVPLDQDLGEHPSVLVNGGSPTPIGAARAGQVAFAISGLASDDSGTLTFSDQAGHAMVVAIANGQAVDSQGHPLSTVNLSSLSDGTITSSLAISDPAGNQFSASGNTVPLDQDLGEQPTVSFSGLTGGHAVEDQIITAIVTDTDNDVPTSGITYTWQISHDGGNTWSTVGGNARTYAPSEADEGGLLKVVTSFTDAAGNTESGSSTVGVLPLLTIANNSLSVSPNGSVSLGISLTQEPTPDDTISVTISFHSSGAHDPTIAAGDHANGNPHTSGGITTYTFSPSDVNSGLTFTNHGDQADALTVNEILNGDFVATSQTITVTDPPVSGAGTIVHDPPVSAAEEDTPVQSTSAYNHLIVSSPFPEALRGNGDGSGLLFRTNLDHHTSADSKPEINFAQNDTNHLHSAESPLAALPVLSGMNAITNVDPQHLHATAVDAASMPESVVNDPPPDAFKTAAGTLQLNDSSAVTGAIFGGDDMLTGTGYVDLKDMNSNSPHLPTQFGDNNPLTATEARTAHFHFDESQLANFRFADDGGSHHGAIVYDPPTLASTGLSTDLIGNSGVASAVMTHATSAQAGSSGEFIFRKDFVHDAIVDLRTDLTDIDHTKLADIQHLLDTVSNSGTNAVSGLDPNHSISPQQLTIDALLHHQHDFYFA